MSILYYFCFVKDKEISSKYIKNHDIIIKKYPKRVVLKVIFISVCHRENEVFYKSFASLLGKQVRVWEQCSQGFNRIVLFYLRMLFTPVNFHLRKFDKELLPRFGESEWGLEQSSKVLTEEYYFICGRCPHLQTFSQKVWQRTLSNVNAIMSLFRKQRPHGFKCLFNHFPL